MRATERYERAWNAFQIHLNHNPKASLIPFLKERHVNHRSMHRWMSEKGYSVRLAKQQIRLLQAEARKECSEAIAKDTGMMFLPMEMPSEPVCPENYLFGITLTFPNGTIVTIKKGSAKSIMHLMKLYEKEDYAMFGLNENTQYYVCQRYVRMNMGINGLYQIVRTEMELPPLGGAVFIFFSKNRQQVELLKWDGEGFLLYQKRLERGTFELPFFDPKNKQCKMPYRTLSAIMSGICLKSMRYRKTA